MRYDKPEPGTWVNPVKNGYKFMCCDCGLVHRMEFKHVPYGLGRRIMFRVWRDNRATASARKSLKYKTRKGI